MLGSSSGEIWWAAYAHTPKTGEWGGAGFSPAKDEQLPHSELQYLHGAFRGMETTMLP